MTSIRRFSAIAFTGISLIAAQTAMADEWVAERLRGSVLTYQDGEWVALKRGDVVADDRYIKTLGDGRVQFTRGAETIDLSGHTLIQILDRDGQNFTNVHQHYGEVAVEAERQNVNHFAIVTPYLAAIVKGTQFVVESGSAGASVSVDRGQVNVADPATGTNVDITPGQGASVDPNGQFEVSAQAGSQLPAIHTDDGLVTDVERIGQSASGGNGAGESQANSANVNGHAKGSGSIGNARNGDGGTDTSPKGNGSGNGNSNAGSGNGNGKGNSESGNGNLGSGNSGNGNSGNGNSNGDGNGNSGNGNRGNNSGNHGSGNGKR